MSLSPIVVAQEENEWGKATFPELLRNFFERIFSQVSRWKPSLQIRRAHDARLTLLLHKNGEERSRPVEKTAASHSPNVTAPEAPMAMLEKIAAWAYIHKRGMDVDPAGNLSPTRRTSPYFAARFDDRNEPPCDRRATQSQKQRGRVACTPESN